MMKAAVRMGTTPIQGLFTFRDVYLPYTAAQMIRFFAPDFASKIGGQSCLDVVAALPNLSQRRLQ